jgi:hypothetical protein
MEPVSCFTNTKEIQMAKLKELRATAEAVGAQTAALDVAGLDASMASAELLAAVLDALRPALRAICSPVAVYSTTTGAGTTTEPSGWRGLYLAGDGPQIVGRHQLDDGAVRGRYGGERLMLRDDGQLVVLRYEGPWSNVYRETSSWTATAAVVDAGAAAGRYDVPGILDALAQALAAQARGGAPARAAKLREKAERLQALVILVRSWR